MLLFFFLLQIIHKALTKGEVDDSRSDSEDSEEEEEGENMKDK